MSTPPGKVPPSSSSTTPPPPGNVPPAAAPGLGRPAGSTDDPSVLAGRIIALSKQLIEIKTGKGGLDAALRRVSAHRTGKMDDAEAWDQLAYQHSRFFVALTDAVGVDSGIDVYASTDEFRRKNLSAAAQTDSDKAQAEHDGKLITASKKGEFGTGSYADTRSWLAFNLGARARPEGYTGTMAINPDETGVDIAIAKKLDQTAIAVLNTLENQLEEAFKNDPTYNKDKTLFKDGYTGSLDMEKCSDAARRNNDPKYTDLITKIEELKVITGKKKKIGGAELPFSRGGGNSFQQLVQDTEDEVGLVDEDWLERRQRDRGIGAWNVSRHSEESPEKSALAAMLGINVSSLAILAGMDSPRFRVMAHVTYDPKTGKPHVTAHVTGIPLFSKKGAQFAAGQLSGSYYEPFFRGKPVMVDKIDPKTGKPETDPLTGKPTGAKVPKIDEVTGKPVLERLTTEEMAKIVSDNPLPLGTLPGGYPDNSIRFLMDLVVLNLAMGGDASFCGLRRDGTGNPIPPYFDDAKIESFCGSMVDSRTGDARVKALFKERLYAHMDQHFPEAVARHQKNVLLPKIYQNAQNSEAFAIERIKAASKDPKGVVITQQMIDDMRKKPLSSKEKARAKEIHDSLPPERRKALETELSIMRYCDANQGVLPSAGLQTEVNQNQATNAKPEGMVITTSDSKDPAFSSEFTDLNEMHAANISNQLLNDDAALENGVQIGVHVEDPNDTTVPGEELIGGVSADTLDDADLADIDEILTFVDPKDKDAIKAILVAMHHKDQNLQAGGQKHPQRMKQILTDLQHVEKTKAPPMLTATKVGATGTSLSVTTKIDPVVQANIQQQRQDAQAKKTAAAGVTVGKMKAH